jgi:arylsulfatase A-like enzyme
MPRTLAYALRASGRSFRAGPAVALGSRIPVLGLIALLFLPAFAGCRSRAAAPVETVRLQSGERYRYADYASPADQPDLVRGQDGLLRLPAWGGSQPVVPAAASHPIVRRFVSPRPLVLETGFGLVPSKGKGAGRARFVVRFVSQGRTRVLLSREVRGDKGADEPGWTPTRIELPAKAGDQIELQLAVEKLSLLSRAPRNAVWVNPTIVAPAAASKPNFVIVILDAVRPDHLGAYGYARDTSPWVDRMAAEGVVYRDAASQATWTLASVGSLLTSSYPLLIGAAQIAAHERGEGPTLERVDMSVSLQGEVRRLGYTTLASTGGGFLDAAAGFSSGFDWFWTPPPDTTTFLRDHLATLKSRLSACSSEPFFLLLHTYEAHNYLQGWDHDLERFSKGYSGRLKDKKALFNTVTQCVAAGLSAADLQYLQDVYDGEIHHTDQELGEFFTWLFAQPWGRNTVVVLTADHGECFGEHGKLHHGGPPYYEVTHVPLIVRYPDGRYRGRQVSDPVALVDIMPTLLRLAGDRVPAGAVGRPLPAPAAGDRLRPPRTILSGCQSPPVLSTRMGDWTYLSGLGSSRQELYDLHTDPGQLHNLVGSAAEQLARMQRALAGQVARAGDAYQLASSGTRPSDVTVTLSCEGGFRYLTQPTSRRLPVANGSQATLTIAAGDAPEVVLFAPTDPEAVVRIDARMDGAPVPPRRLHLGVGDRRAARLPVEVGASTVRLIQAAASPPLESDEWGLWLRSVPGNPVLGDQTSPGTAVPMSEEARARLRALGYVK